MAPRYVESAVLACLSKFGGCEYGLRGSNIGLRPPTPTARVAVRFLVVRTIVVESRYVQESLRARLLQVHGVERPFLARRRARGVSQIFNWGLAINCLSMDRKMRFLNASIDTILAKRQVLVCQQKMDELRAKVPSFIMDIFAKP